MAPDFITRDGHSWSVGAGCAMYTGMDYAVRTQPGKYRLEVHDTPQDQAPSDIGTQKRRAILSAASSSDYFVNGKTYHLSFDFIVHWADVAKQILAGDGHQIMEVHTGSHPALAWRITKDAKLLQLTTATDSNIVRASAPFTLDKPHHIDMQFQTGSSTSFVSGSIDGVAFAKVSGGVGSTTENNRKLKVGIYAGNGLSGNSVVMEIWNVSPFPVAV
jgi:hypothetical protein